MRLAPVCILGTIAALGVWAWVSQRQLSDHSLKREVFATYPEIETPTTVTGAPDGSVYVGNDPRDSRLNTTKPECSIVRFSSLAPGRKRTVFATGIYSPAGSAWHDGWLYVVHDPFLTRFRDTDGDGVADVREDLITNLGPPPSEGLNDHVVSGLTLGMDGFFYISVGDRGIYKARGTDGAELTLCGGGIVRCRPDGTRLEVFSTGTRNHLSVALDAEDNAFTLDNSDDGNGWWTRLTHHIEGGYYGYPFDYQRASNYGVTRPSAETLETMKRNGHASLGKDSTPFLPAMTDFGAGSPTGGLCYLSDGLPAQYRGKLFFSEWGKQSVSVVETAREGATFRFVKNTPLLQSVPGSDFRPMQLSVAADGSLLIADWGWGGWKSSKKVGTIWRVSWPKAKPAPRLKDERKASVEELIASLGHPDRDQRLRAQYALAGKGESVAAKLTSIVKDERAADAPRVHALWALNQISHAEATASQAKKPGHLPQTAEETQNLLAEIMKSAKPSLQVQAIRAFSLDRDMPMKSDTTHAMLALTGSSAPEVRMQAIIGAGRMWGSDPQRLVAGLGDDDAWVRAAARLAIQRNLWNPRISMNGQPTPHIRDVLAVALVSAQPRIRDGAWQTLEQAFDRPTMAMRMAQWNDGQRRESGLLDDTGFAVVSILAEFAKSPSSETRSRAVTALGRIAYQPLPYEGQRWGGQPVKTPPPPNSVPWAITPQALALLTPALSDPDTAVRLAATKAFTSFLMDDAGETPRTPTGAAPLTKDAASTSGLTQEEAVRAASEALRQRLTIETDAQVRRQLIVALGVQKDAQAVEVFRKIALDEKVDAEFRETAIGAVVNIGGDAAKKTIAQLSSAKLSPAATRTIVKAAGELKVLEATPALIAHLKDADPSDREIAARALQQLGPKSAASPALIAALDDSDPKVQAAAIDALGSLRDKAALPALIALAEKKRSMKEAIGALANMPDESAIPVLVETLREKNTSIRRNAIKALRPMREKAWPQIEALLAKGRVPEELVPEIKKAFESGAITKWKMVGVFENVWDAVHPPEADALANGGTANLAATYHNAEGKDVGWIDVTADATEGRVDLEKVFKTNAMACAYAFTEIDAPQAADAKLFTSADDEIGVWLNGQRVLDVSGNHPYEPDKNETTLALKPGKNQLLVKIGNKGGSWAFHARMLGLENGKFTKSKETSPEEKQRLFALATRPDGTYVNAGDAKKGEKLFFDQSAALGGVCATCHAVGAKGGQIGPALTTVGTNYKRADLITSIHEPSKTIALGFEQVALETTSGESIAGSLRTESGDAFTIVDAAGQSHTVKKADVKTKTDLHVSLMPQGLTLSLKPTEFTDLLAYLESLKGQ